MLKVNDIRNQLLEKYQNNDFVIDKSGSKLIEIVGASFEVDEPIIFGEENKDYIEREIKWYMSMSLNVNDIPGETPKIWKSVADPDGLINSNYGWCILSEDNHTQFRKVVATLKEHRESRQAIMIYTRPTMHEDSKKNGMKDFMCTNAVQYIIRDNVLYSIVQMRSNDVVFGFKNDFAWQTHVSKMVAHQLGCPVRKIIWQVGSLHLYERHFNLLENEKVGA